MIENSAELLLKLHTKNPSIIDNFLPENYGTIWIVIDIILDRKMRKIEIKNLITALKKNSDHSIAKIIAVLDARYFGELIAILENILNDFGDFEEFAKKVSREWLLEQKGLGAKKTDYILLFACERDEMAASIGAAKLLAHFGREFDDYDEIRDFLSRGVKENFDQIEKILRLPIAQTFAYFYALIARSHT